MYDMAMESGAFSAFRSDFNLMLKDTLSQMEDRMVKDAEITVKFNISLREGVTDDALGGYAGAQREYIRPDISHKINTCMKVTSSVSGWLDGNYELVWKDGKYQLRELGEQLTIEDEEDNA